MGKDAAFKVFAESFLDVGRWRVVIALAVELAGACQLKPSLEMLGHRLVKQGALGVAGVVGFGGFSGLAGCNRLGVRVSTWVLVSMWRRLLL